MSHRSGPLGGKTPAYVATEAWMLKAPKTIIGAMSYDHRPDILGLLVHGEQGWQTAGSARTLTAIRLTLTDEALASAADASDTDPTEVVALVEGVRRTAG